MGFRAVWLIPAAAAVAALGVACGADDPDAITVDPGHGPSRTGPGFDGSIPDTGSTPPPSKETGGESSAEGGIEDATIPIDAPKDTGESKDVAMLEDSPAAAVFGSTVYAGMLPATTAAMYHSMKGGPNGIPSYKTGCLSCHDGKTTGTVEFLFGGSLYGDPDGGISAPNIEVRVVDSKGKAVSAYSDTNGNFWAEATAALSTPALAGARNSTSVQIMPGTVSSGDCNTCHNGSAMTAALLNVP